jgi:hypothetical protein
VSGKEKNDPCDYPLGIGIGGYKTFAGIARMSADRAAREGRLTAAMMLDAAAAEVLAVDPGDAFVLMSRLDELYRIVGHLRSAMTPEDSEPPTPFPGSPRTGKSMMTCGGHVNCPKCGAAAGDRRGHTRVNSMYGCGCTDIFWADRDDHEGELRAYHANATNCFKTEEPKMSPTPAELLAAMKAFDVIERNVKTEIENYLVLRGDPCPAIHLEFEHPGGSAVLDVVLDFEGSPGLNIPKIIHGCANTLNTYNIRNIIAHNACQTYDAKTGEFVE